MSELVDSTAIAEGETALYLIYDYFDRIDNFFTSINHTVNKKIQPLLPNTHTQLSPWLQYESISPDKRILIHSIPVEDIRNWYGLANNWETGDEYGFSVSIIDLGQNCKDPPKWHCVQEWVLQNNGKGFYRKYYTNLLGQGLNYNSLVYLEPLRELNISDIIEFGESINEVLDTLLLSKFSWKFDNETKKLC